MYTLKAKGAQTICLAEPRWNIPVESRAACGKSGGHHKILCDLKRILRVYSLRSVDLAVIVPIVPELEIDRPAECFNRPKVTVKNLTDSLKDGDHMYFDFGDGVHRISRK